MIIHSTIYKKISCKLTGTLLYFQINKCFYPGSTSNHLIFETQRLLLNKMILFNFCTHFKTKSLTELLADNLFVDYVHKCIHQKPTLHSRAFQLALEMTYSKRKFELHQLECYYNNDFRIEDTFQVNKNICDQSTIYTSVITKNVVDFLNLDKKDVVVHSTPLFLSKEKITQSIKEMMDYNKQMTGNTCADISIKERPYDYKDSRDVSYNKNHLYFIDQENIVKECTRHLQLLESSLWSNIKSCLMENETLKYSKEVIKIINNGQHIGQSSPQIYEQILIFIKKSPPPKTFKMPLFIYKTKANITDLSSKISSTEADTVPLEPGKLNDVKVKKAIGGLIDAWPNHLKEIVQKATSDAFLFPSINDNIID